MRDVDMFDTVKDRREEAKWRMSGEIDRSVESRNESTCTLLKQKRADGTLSILTKVNSITWPFISTKA
jgi:hypothetical protein